MTWATALQLLGLALLAVGAGLLAVWLGLVVAGAGLLVFGVALEMGERLASELAEPLPAAAPKPAMRMVPPAGPGSISASADGAR